ncbi:hypothetical protein L3Q82_021231 [Scortum barcoo]|uniref:Uncharacterized protein n=1 Tax=Scortum barcoo TaxID=214431 RepID=A0ACB8X3Y5_9TELE|nr:hypothetical protein L3Q82_021231 [Scortum barcoo]
MFKSQLEESYKIAMDNAAKTTLKNKTRFDRCVIASDLEPRDRVLIRNVRIRGKHKISDKWDSAVHVVVSRAEKMSSQVRLSLLPSARCLFDEPVQVKVGGLRSRQVVTMRARSTDEKGVVFSSTATVGSKGIGIVSRSKAGDIALSLASFVPGVEAVVWINGCNANALFPLYHKKQQILSPLLFDFSKGIPTESGAIIIKYALNNPLAEENKSSLVPIEQARGRFLFVASADDLHSNSKVYMEEMVERLKRHGKDNFESMCYPGAGHYMEPPYGPYCPSSFHRFAGMPVLWGGEARSHAAAEVHLWKKIQEFFKTYLSKDVETMNPVTEDYSPAWVETTAVIPQLGSPNAQEPPTSFSTAPDVADSAPNNEKRPSPLPISRRILQSLLSPAADVVKGVRPDSPPLSYLQLLDSAFSMVEDGEELYAQFMNTIQDPDLEPRDRVLIRNVRIRGNHKISDKWESAVHVVVSRAGTLPVYTVKPENKDGPSRTLHRDLLLPCRYLPQEEINEPVKRPEGRRPATRASPDVESDHSSEEDDELLPVCWFRQPPDVQGPTIPETSVHPDLSMIHNQHMQHVKPSGTGPDGNVIHANDVDYIPEIGKLPDMSDVGPDSPLALEKHTSCQGDAEIYLMLMSTRTRFQWFLNLPDVDVHKDQVPVVSDMTFSVHEEEGEGRMLAEATNERLLMADGVSRLDVNEGNISGVLFTPPGDGPFPAVLDLSTFKSEKRASLLANRGFVVLTVTVFNDKPANVKKMHLDYFEEAADFLKQHPKVGRKGIGIVSRSKAGDIALSLASFVPGVEAVVWINGCNANVAFPLYHKKQQILSPLLLDFQQEDDLNWDSKAYMEEMVERLKRHGKDNFESVCYPGAGHYMEPPYGPYCPSSFHGIVGKPALWGEKMSSQVRLRLLPRARCLFDEPVQVKVGGLRSRQVVTMRARSTDEKGVVFSSMATYRADGRGEIHLDRDPSLGWELRRGGTSGSAFSVHEEEGEGRMLAEAINERLLMADGVSRLDVNEGNISGVLFTPPGAGPFSAVLDLYVLGGLLSEKRASLLASRGFVVLTVVAFGYDDMPKNIKEVYLDYFEEAIQFLKRQDKVGSEGVGVISFSKTADVALSVASYLPDIEATVWINGCCSNTVLPLYYRKSQILSALMFDVSKVIPTESGAIMVKYVLNNPLAEENKDTLVPIEQARGHFLFVASEDDLNWDSKAYMEEMVERLKRHGKDNFESVCYPGAGHYLEPPYGPYCPSSFHGVVGKPVLWGEQSLNFRKDVLPSQTEFAAERQMSVR